ncbi:MAG: glycosyltransferase family 2 protein [Firmicutes bacterium]|nr:glycosyltransferase family 2 protein [Bacillota bacterium]
MENETIEKIKKLKSRKDLTVSVITCTNRPYLLDNILNNYLSQDFKDKELIIIINKDNVNLDKIKNKINNYKDIKVFKLSSKYSLGRCLNEAISKSKYNIVAKFDDDDYYGKKYLSSSINSFLYTDADIIGKSASFVYFKESKILAIRNPKKENRYVSNIEGSTMIINKDVFNYVKFRDISLGEDRKFCSDCNKKGIKIYAHDKFNHVYIRHGYSHSHTWSASDDFFKKLCFKIGKVDDYKSYVNK